jgi:putative ABC transport system permease protein
MTDFLTDVRTVIRGWRRTPALSATVVITLALGLGLAAAIFSFADGYLFRALPFPSPDQLYFVRDPQAPIALLAADTDALRHSDVGDFGFVEWSAGHRVSGDRMIVEGRPVPVWTNDVTPGFGQTLQVPLIAGRMFEDADHREGASVSAWISYGFWQREFGGDPAILNRSYRITGRRPVDVTIVGILNREVASFDLNNEPPDLVAPGLVEVLPKVINRNYLSFPIVRLPGTMTRTEGEARISAALQAVAPAADGRQRVIQLRPLRAAQVAGGAPTARVLFTGALLVLLLVSINLVHLLLAQGVARAGEIATRAALGASRWRIARLFLVESIILGMGGISGGLLLGAWLSKVIAARIPQFPTVGRNLALVPMVFDARVVVSAVVLGILIAALGTIWPAWRAIRRPLHVATRSLAGVKSAVPARISRVVLASELGVATVLLLGTVFIGQGIWTYLHRPLGFNYADRVSVDVDLMHPAGELPYASPSEWASVRGAIAAIPGVKAVGAYRLGDGQPIAVRGEPFPKSQAYNVGEGYFEAWQVRLVAGRLFSADEMRGEAPVAVVDAAFASRAWPTAQAIGQDLRVGTGLLRRVVGVVETQVRSLRSETLSEAYIPRSETTGSLYLVAWAPGLSSEQLLNRLIPTLKTILPGAVASAESVTFTRLFNRQTGEAEFQGPIMLAFGVLTFVLAGIGAFGLVSYLIAQRTREFGIRLALGARSHDIWRAVVRESVWPALAGLSIGNAAAWALERFVRANAFGWASSGLIAVALVTVAMLAVAVIAAASPARRALRIDPSVVLRAE